MNLFKKYKSKLVIVLSIIFLSVLILAYLLNDSIKGIINILVISFMLSYSVSPIRDSIESRFKIKKSIASLLIIFIILGACVTCTIVIIPALIKEVSNIGIIFDNIGSFLEKLSVKLKISSFPAINVIYNEVLERGNTIFLNLSKSLVNNFLLIAENLISCAVIPIIVYYFLCDGEKIYNNILLLLPTEKRALTKKILKDIDNVLGRYIVSQLVLSAIIGGLTFILLIVFKVKFPIWISILNAIFNIIPYFGPIFGGIPAIIVALLDSPIKAIWITIGIFLIQQIEGNILSPKITGDSTDMHPIVIIILLLIGDKFGGFLGMIIAVPIGVIIKVLYDDINYYLF
ncbi:AI-2E family transporter [Clostridium uliginosum]|uniref:Predicted PurR-regulated permease PerM n=1 Tax=Clostridium uliginosum TaxID=119641 RepID=A0A1I1LM41_9CLOT|nr:AI-2E family transporter [Clostridium uliginosum]SFC71383.1 Predicted PurR-regulated permease PerM [Clostridium uliginosum]